MNDRCISHQFEEAQGYCRHCHHPFCRACLVWPFGENNEPLCIACALTAAGVRRGAQRRPASRSQRRNRDHERRRRQHRPTTIDEPGPLGEDDLEEVATLPTLGDLVTVSASVEQPSRSVAAESLAPAEAAVALPFFASEPAHVAEPEPAAMAAPPPPAVPRPRSPYLAPFRVPTRHVSGAPEDAAPRPASATPTAHSARARSDGPAATSPAPRQAQQERPAAAHAAPPPFEPAPPRRFKDGRSHSSHSAVQQPLVIAPWPE